jgi:hypothetical protein
MIYFFIYNLFFLVENLHSKRINSRDSNKHRITENNEHKENDHHSKKLNERRTSTPDKSIIIENIHIIPDTTRGLVEKHAYHSTKEPTLPGKSNK